jgi:hypothetical protein
MKIHHASSIRPIKNKLFTDEIYILFVSAFMVMAKQKSTVKKVDLCIYGGTSAGVIAAYTAQKMGKTAIRQPRAKKLKEVQVEALHADFKKSWEQKDFKTIVTLGDMIPQNIPAEDEQLLMYYDIAKDSI